MTKSMLGRTVVSAALVAAGLFVNRPASAQGVVTANVEVRRTSVPNSCDYSVFQPEIKITNTGAQSFFLSQGFIQVYFNAGLDEIEAVHPTGITAAIFDANGAFKSWDGVSISRGVTFNTVTFAPDRRANQAWRIFFDPPQPPGQGPDITMRPGDFAIFTVSFRRAGGQNPFDPECDDFTKVERGAPSNFTNDKFYNLLFTSTQQFICEFLNPTTPDPQSGVNPFTARSACP
jgi:hypothetical protein